MFKVIQITRLISEAKLKWWLLPSALFGFIYETPIYNVTQYFIESIGWMIVAFLCLLPIWLLFKPLGWVAGKILQIPKGGSILDLYGPSEDSYEEPVPHIRKSKQTNVQPKSGFEIWRYAGGTTPMKMQGAGAPSVAISMAQRQKAQNPKYQYVVKDAATGATIWSS